MANNENVLTVRLSESILLKLENLVDVRNRELERIGMKKIGKKEIVEEAIKEIYFRMINRTRDPDVVERVQAMVHDEVKSSLGNLHRKTDEILFLSIKNDYGNKIFYRSPSVLPSPKDRAEAISIIVNEPSRWDDALEEYMKKKWMSEKEHVHKGGDKE